MGIKEIVLVSVIDKDGIEPLLTKAFTNKDEAEGYFRDLVGNELSSYYDDNEDYDKESDIDVCLDLGYYTNCHEYGKTISISEIELYE